MSHRRAPDTTATTGSAPARICLGGEDLDWIGGPSLMTAINLRVEVTYERRSAARTLAIDAAGSLRARLVLPRAVWSVPTDGELELVRLCWQQAVEPPVGGRITIASGVPTSAGLASSATTCVAALRAFLPGEPTPDVLADTAYDVEHQLAGRPVGPMDFVPAASGGTVLVGSRAEAITGITHLNLHPAARFLVVDTRTPRDTGAVIAWKRSRFEAGERDIRIYAERMTALVERQADLVGSGTGLDELGDTLDQAHALLADRLKVSTPLIDSCAARLRSAGALGAKLTGTGLGGCLFALTTADADIERLTHSLGELPVSTHLVRTAERAIAPALSAAEFHITPTRPADTERALGCPGVGGSVA